MKSIRLILVAAAFAFAASATAQNVVNMKSDITPHVDPGHEAAKVFADNVAKKTNGSVKIAVFPDNQLGSPPEMLEQNILGTIDMSMPTQGALDKYSKKFAVVMLPFVFRDANHAFRVLDGPFIQWASPDLEKRGWSFSRTGTGDPEPDQQRPPGQRAGRRKGLKIGRPGTRSCKPPWKRWAAT